MKNMSVSKTKEQCYAYLKNVTRRQGWEGLRPGEVIQLVEKGQGLKAGDRVKKIHPIQVLSFRAERLDKLTTFPDYGRLEMIREGFPEMDPQDFITMYCKMNKCKPESMVNRISFAYYLNPSDPNLALKVPASVAVCPSCSTTLTINPYGYYLTRDGTLACDSFGVSCENEPEDGNRDQWESYDQTHAPELAGGGADRLKMYGKIESWLLDTFRFEIGGGDEVNTICSLGYDMEKG